MADQTHLDLLDEGVEVWNRWRKDEPSATPDLRGAQLSGRKLRGIDLSRGEWRANLIDAQLNHADLTDANLREASLNLAQLEGATLVRADLRYAEFLDGTLQFADLSGADCRDANISCAKLVETHLERASLSYASLYRSDLTDANLADADLFTALPRFGEPHRSHGRQRCLLAVQGIRRFRLGTQRNARRSAGSRHKRDRGTECHG